MRNQPKLECGDFVFVADLQEKCEIIERWDHIVKGWFGREKRWYTYTIQRYSGDIIERVSEEKLAFLLNDTSINPGWRWK